jgi:hypothetical protein
VSSTAVPSQRLLTLEILQLPELKPSYHSLPCRTLSVHSIDNCQLPIINSGVRIRVTVVRFTANQFVLGASPLRLKTRNSF